MSKTPRVLLLTQYFPPETGAAQTRLFEMARILVRRGFQVEVLTALPNYPQGRIYDDYRGKLFAIDHVEGMRVVRAPIIPSRSAGLVRRMSNYLSFVFSSMLVGLLLTRRPDVIICESPPLFLGISALFLKTVKWCRLIFNVSDLFPESAIRMGMHDRKSLIWMARQLERLCYMGSNAVTAQSPGIVRGVRQQCPEGIVELISNGCDCDLFHSNNRSESYLRSLGIEDHIVVGYAGLVGLAQGVGFLIEAADRLRDDDRIRFLIAGDGPERELIEAEIRQKELTNVIFAGWVAKREMPKLVASFDIAFVPLRYFIPGALPSKIYESMASERSVLLAAEGDAREVIERADAGMIVPYGDSDELVRAIRCLADDPGERQRLGNNGREYVLAHHQRQAIAIKFGDLIESVANDSGQARRAA